MPTPPQQHPNDQRKIYLSAPYGRRDEMVPYAEELRNAGNLITSNWIYGDHDLVDPEHRRHWTTDLGTDDAVDPEAQPIAIEDYRTLVEATTIVFFSEKPSNPTPRGSRHVEFGIALSLDMEILVIGPRENLFHTMPGVQHWPTWEKFKQHGPCFKTPTKGH